jgi:DNA end-binding protein Ku
MAATIWKGYLSFGLVSIPVKLFRAARAEKIHMHRLERATGGRVRQVFVPAETEHAMNQVPPRPVTAAGPSLVAAKNQPEQPQRLKQTSSQEVKHGDPGAAASAQTIAPSEMVRGFEFEKGKYAAFEPEELEQIAPQTSPDMQVIEFVRFNEVDPVYLETSYYVSPDKGG